ncbi:hypothetical protein ACVBEQ_24450 [Nakamurella sp. GG22]
MTLRTYVRLFGCGMALLLAVGGCTSTDAATSIPTSTEATPSASVQELSTAALGSASGTEAMRSSEGGQPTADVTIPSTSFAQSTTHSGGDTSASVAVAPTAPSDLRSPSNQEELDRAAIEAQWGSFWRIYNGIVRIPEENRLQALDQVSVDPIKSRILNAAKQFDRDGLDYYGVVVQHPYWVTSVNGDDFAVMRDCQDQSQYGSVYVKTQVKRSVGVAENNLQAGFVRGIDGRWRVQKFDHLGDVPC